MTENFILNAFRKCGEDPQAVKLMKNKYTGEPAGYCFVNFNSDDQAIDAMHKLNGKPIPGTNPIVRYRLNSATNNNNKIMGPIEREYSVWVGDLSTEVDDYSLYKAFAGKYNSIRSAKVILDGGGFSKGYGFVRFGLEEEQRSALYEMTGYVGLGTKALKICNAVPKPKGDMAPEPPVSATTIVQNAFAAAAAASVPDYSQYYDPSTSYWQNYSGWSNNVAGGGYYDQHGAANANPSAAAGYYHQHQQQQSGQWGATAGMYAQEDDDMALVEHKRELDVDAFNREAIESDRNFYDALESSKWIPIEQLEAF